MESSKIEFLGTPCGHHGPYTFYKAIKYSLGNKSQILSLGEFFYVKHSEDAPICIGEVQLLWVDKNTCHDLSSVRLYFLPEHTPEGKQQYHGEDEILAVSEKIVLKIEDLLKWMVYDVTWTAGSKAIYSADEKNDDIDIQNNIITKSFSNNSALDWKDIEKEKKALGVCNSMKGTEVIILSYSQYCRYKAILKRLEGVTDKWLRNTLVCAIGGFTFNSKNARILFCKDTFEHPELEELEVRCDELAPNLKGRPRKKKRLKKESSIESESGEESTSMDSVSFKKSQARGERRNGKSMSPKDMAEADFLAALYKFMRNRQSPITKVPSLGFKTIDLYYFYSSAQKYGGYEQITNKRLWKHLYDKLGGNPGSTSAATCTRRHYEKLLLPFERYVKGELHKPLPVPYKQPPRRPTSDTEGRRGQKIKNEQEIAWEDRKRNSNLGRKKFGTSLELMEKERKWEEMRRHKILVQKVRQGHPNHVFNKESDMPSSSKVNHQPVGIVTPMKSPTTLQEPRELLRAETVKFNQDGEYDKTNRPSIPPPLQKQPLSVPTLGQKKVFLHRSLGQGQDMSSSSRPLPPPLVKTSGGNRENAPAKVYHEDAKYTADGKSTSNRDSIDGQESFAHRPSVIQHTHLSSKGPMDSEASSSQLYTRIQSEYGGVFPPSHHYNLPMKRPYPYPLPAHQKKSSLPDSYAKEHRSLYSLSGDVIIENAHSEKAKRQKLDCRTDDPRSFLKTNTNLVLSHSRDTQESCDQPFDLSMKSMKKNNEQNTGAFDTKVESKPCTSASASSSNKYTECEKTTLTMNSVSPRPSQQGTVSPKVPYHSNIVKRTNSPQSMDSELSRSQSSASRSLLDDRRVSPVTPSSGGEDGSDRPAFITSYFDPHGIESQQALAKHVITREGKVVSPELKSPQHPSATPKSSSAIQDFSPLLHPAYPQMLSPPSTVHPGILHSPQQLIEAQLQAHAAHRAAYEEMIRAQMYPHPSPLFVPQSQLYPHLYSEGQQYLFPQ
ncbi:AT-rich interactive domain-containing protein 5B [Lingula anatina]|uniref:AT-rich interactive domain-containing protein 5B n=1 Tax=Lingula anatina TaxID=7574 RepID=A0A1S3K9U7_LINAN|nr:AT-rich interactive domain-containing protein 5B [Lingula anatina]|eukprot:XP_013419272.1 AT-rich interactive domain-containing protein 5B [Lingula anatina]